MIGITILIYLTSLPNYTVVEVCVRCSFVAMMVTHILNKEVELSTLTMMECRSQGMLISCPLVSNMCVLKWSIPCGYVHCFCSVGTCGLTQQYSYSYKSADLLRLEFRVNKCGYGPMHISGSSPIRDHSSNTIT